MFQPIHQLNQLRSPMCNNEKVINQLVQSCTQNLKEPLDSIKRLMKLAEKTSTNPFTKECFTLMDQSVSQMDNFIAMLQYYVKNTNQRPRYENIDFKDCIGNVINTKLPYAKTNEVKINVKISQSESFCSDPFRLAIIFKQLIDNAFSFLDPNKSERFVDVDVKVSDKEAHFEICDNGKGIKKEHLNEIFNLFDGQSMPFEGTKFGLVLVKEVINKLNGNIQVSSTPGVGSNFIVKIPNSKGHI